MIVVDTNIVAYLLTQNARTEEARRLWIADRDWWAPRLLVYELTNVFTRLVRQRAVSAAAAGAGLSAGVRIVRVPDQEPPPGRVLEIASKLGLSAYDAAYLAMAEKLGTPLITEDVRILGAAPGLAQSLADAV